MFKEELNISKFNHWLKIQTSTDHFRVEKNGILLSFFYKAHKRDKIDSWKKKLSLQRIGQVISTWE